MYHKLKNLGDKKYEYLISSARSASSLKAHLVLVPKSRRELFNDQMLSRLETIVKNLLKKWNCRSIEEICSRAKQTCLVKGSLSPALLGGVATPSPSLRDRRGSSRSQKINLAAG